jgi:hypothetical protein
LQQEGIARHAIFADLLKRVCGFHIIANWKLIRNILPLYLFTWI